MSDERPSFSPLKALFGNVDRPPSGSSGAQGRRRPLQIASEQEVKSAWHRLHPLSLTAKQSDRGRLISLDRRSPENIAFDMLRTSVWQAMAKNGWRRLAVTSPTKGCGKTFVSCNLAVSLARRKGSRIGLIDLDLRRPALAEVFGIVGPGLLGAFLDGTDSYEQNFLRLGDNLAIGVNGLKSADPAEQLQDPRTADALLKLEATLALDALVIDTPPMMVCDDFLSISPEVDCVLVVVGGGVTRSEEVERCAEMIGDLVPILGFVLNQADDPSMDRYQY